MSKEEQVMTLSSTGFLKAAAIAAGVVACPLALAPSALAADINGVHGGKVQAGAHMSGAHIGRVNAGVQGGERMSRGMERGRVHVGIRAAGERSLRAGAVTSRQFRGERFDSARVARERFRGERLGVNGGYYRTGGYYGNAGLYTSPRYYGARRFAGTGDFRSGTYRTVGYSNRYYGGYGRNFVGYAPGYYNDGWNGSWNPVGAALSPVGAALSFVGLAPGYYNGYSAAGWGWGYPPNATNYVGYYPGSGCTCGGAYVTR